LCPLTLSRTDFVFEAKQEKYWSKPGGNASNLPPFFLFILKGLFPCHLINSYPYYFLVIF